VSHRREALAVVRRRWNKSGCEQIDDSAITHLAVCKTPAEFASCARITDGAFPVLAAAALPALTIPDITIRGCRQTFL
jgi:hypothetical protein